MENLFNQEISEKSLLNKLYWKDGLSTVEITKKLGYPKGKVYSKMKKYGIPRRNPNEGMKNYFLTHNKRKEYETFVANEKNNQIKITESTIEKSKSLEEVEADTSDVFNQIQNLIEKREEISYKKGFVDGVKKGYGDGIKKGYENGKSNAINKITQMFKEASNG